MDAVPEGRELVVSVAMPWASSTPVPSDTVPFRKVTVPDGMALLEVAVTVAISARPSPVVMLVDETWINAVVLTFAGVMVKVAIATALAV
jgi:hypothetical protein